MTLFVSGLNVKVDLEQTIYDGDLTVGGDFIVIVMSYD